MGSTLRYWVEAKVIDAIIEKMLSWYDKVKGIKGKDPVIGIGEAVYPAHRWKVERTISWLNNMRKLRTRWEKKACNYRGLWLLAVALMIFRLIVLG